MDIQGIPGAVAGFLRASVEPVRVWAYWFRCRPDHWFGYAPRLDHGLLLVARDGWFTVEEFCAHARKKYGAFADVTPDGENYWTEERVGYWARASLTRRLLEPAPDRWPGVCGITDRGLQRVGPYTFRWWLVRIIAALGLAATITGLFGVRGKTLGWFTLSYAGLLILGAFCWGIWQSGPDACCLRPTARVRPGPDGLARRRRALEALSRESCHKSAWPRVSGSA